MPSLCCAVERRNGKEVGRYAGQSRADMMGKILEIQVCEVVVLPFSPDDWTEVDPLHATQAEAGIYPPSPKNTNARPVRQKMIRKV